VCSEYNIIINQSDIFVLTNHDKAKFLKVKWAKFAYLNRLYVSNASTLISSSPWALASLTSLYILDFVCVWSLLIVLSTPSDEISCLELFFLFCYSLRYFFFTSFLFSICRLLLTYGCWFLSIFSPFHVSYLDSANESYFTLYFLGCPWTHLFTCAWY